jgi:hypothetical protein
MKREKVLELCASDPNAIVSYIESLDSLNHEEILALCASNPEVIVSYIESHPMNDIYDWDDWWVSRKRPDLSLNLYKRNSDCDLCEHVYNGNKCFSLYGVYAYGYLEAIKKLIRDVKRDEFSEGLPCSDHIGYPIFYLSNHYLELKMKEIVRKGKYILPIEDRKRTLASHDLVLLWTSCEKIIQELGFWEQPGYSEDTIKKCKMDRETIYHFIKEIAQDKGAQAFRYPESKERQLFLINSPKCLNVSALSDVVVWLSDQLEGISLGIDEHMRIEGENYETFLDSL